jgi:hypothetical protein
MDKSMARNQVWIEGIGSTVGLIQTGEIESSVFSSKLLCCKKNGSMLWQSPDATCYYSNTNDVQKLVFTEDKTKAQTLVLPIDFSSIDLKIRIYRADGKIVKSKKLKTQKDLSFRKLKPGVYFVEILDYFDKIYYTKKLKIQ